MTFTIPRHNWETEQDERDPVHDAILQEFLDYMFKPRINTIPWLDMPEDFDRKIKQFRRRLTANDTETVKPPRTWQQLVVLYREGPTPLSWEEIARTTGKSVAQCRGSYGRHVRTQRATAA